MKNYLCANRTMLLPARVALCAGVGTALTVSNGLATGAAIAAGLFIALLPRRQQG